jgi:hypothetical protein
MELTLAKESPSTSPLIGVVAMGLTDLNATVFWQLLNADAPPPYLPTSTSSDLQELHKTIHGLVTFTHQA